VSAVSAAARTGPLTQRTVAAGLAVLAAFALWRALALAWLCDDAFISIRYAANLADGLGLVYNAGERVEGYTNFLWTAALAVAAAAGASPVTTATYAGIACYAGLAWVLAAQSRRRGAATGLPLAAALVLISDDFHVWATGGLETMLFTWLATHGLLLTRGSDGCAPHARAAGWLLAALVATRPDGLLFAAAGCASYWLPAAPLSAAERRRHAWATALPVLAVIAVGVPVKLAYYGEILPTAFYSKSVLRPYLSQGLVYLGLYLLKNWYLVAALVAGVVLRQRIASSLADEARRDAIFFAGSAALFLAYIVEVGGDFMFARRILPAVPLLLLALERCLAGLAPPRLRWTLATALLVGAALPLPLYGEAPGDVSGVFDERRSYPEEKIAARRHQGAVVREALAGVPVRAAFEGGMCVFGYYRGLPYLVEATGLTQYSLAKRPLGERGLVGHEKAPDAEWFAANRIHLLFRRDLPPVGSGGPGDTVDGIRFGDAVRAQILHYDDAVMDPLRDRPGVHFVPIEAVILRAAQEMATAPLPAAEAIYDQLDRYYFRTAGDRGEDAARALRAIVERKRSNRGSQG